MEPAPGSHILFAPSEPPRDGRFALWTEEAGVTGTPVGLVLPKELGLRRITVAARMLTMPEAMRSLLAPDAPSSASAWADALSAGLDLVGRGRVSASPGGGWRAGPLAPEDELRLVELGAALPPESFAMPVSGIRNIRLHSPASLVRALWDAVADVLGGELDQTLDGATLILRVEPRYAEEEDGVEPLCFAGVLALRSTADPSLEVDVGELDDEPEVVRSRFGGQLDASVRLLVRQAAEVWRPLAREVDGEVQFADDEVLDLLHRAGGDLAAAGVEVRWPKGLSEERARLAATAALPSESPPQLTLTSLLAFRWQVSVGELALSAAEVTALAEAKRPLVRVRGRWVRADTMLAARLRTAPPEVTGAQALAAALTGELEVAGQQVEFVPPPVVDGLLEKLRDVGGAGASGDEMVEPSPELRATLRPYQLSGLAWLARMTELGLGGVLADDMGLGKTVQLIALHLHRRELAAGPTLVLCPASLLSNWEREVARFAPSVAVRRFHGGGRSLAGLGPHDLVLATYGVLLRDRATLSTVDWGLVAADEAQLVKNALSKTARELRRLPTAARVALTGTPMENRLTELWSIVDWTTPGLLGSLEHFRRTVARPIERSGDQAVTARLAATVRPFLLRRRKSDPEIAPELPAKTETDRFVNLTREQVTLYEAVVRENLAVIRASGGVQRRGQVLKLLTELKQICGHPALYLKEPGPLPRRSGKLAAFEELLDAILDGGESVLVFSQYVSMLRLLESWLAGRGLPTELLSGSASVGERDRMVARFQSGEVPVFLLSLKVGGVGLNLTRATQVIHYDRWWNPAVEDQATDRAYRIGQDQPVQVHRLITEGTLEERIAAMLVRKRGLADAVVGAGENWITELSDAELADLVRLGS